MFLERALVQWLETEHAHEMLRMELAAHSGDASAHDRLLTGRTERAAPCMEVLFAVRQAVVIKEASRIKRRVAFLKPKQNTYYHHNTAHM